MPNPDHIDGYFDMSVPGSCSTQLNGAFVVHANGSTQLTYKGAASGGSVTLNFVAVNPLGDGYNYTFAATWSLSSGAWTGTATRSDGAGPYSVTITPPANGHMDGACTVSVSGQSGLNGTLTISVNAANPLSYNIGSNSVTLQQAGTSAWIAISFSYTDGSGTSHAFNGGWSQSQWMGKVTNCPSVMLADGDWTATAQTRMAESAA